MIQKNSSFKISKVYTIGLQRYGIRKLAFVAKTQFFLFDKIWFMKCFCVNLGLLMWMSLNVFFFYVINETISSFLKKGKRSNPAGPSLTYCANLNYPIFQYLEAVWYVWVLPGEPGQDRVPHSPRLCGDRHQSWILLRPSRTIPSSYSCSSWSIQGMELL